MVKKSKQKSKKSKPRKKRQKGGSQCYSTACADHALKVINDKNALVPFNKNTLELPLLSRQNIKQKGGAGTNVWRRIGLSKPNDLMNNIFDGISNVKNTWLGDKQGPTSNTLKHPITNNEKILMDTAGNDKITIDAYLRNANLPDDFLNDGQKNILLGSGKKRRKSRRKSLRKSRKKRKKSKKLRRKGVRRTKKRRKQRRK